MTFLKRAHVTTILSLLLLLMCVSVASALPDSARAMAASSAKDPTFFYAGFSDAQKFAESLGRSELARLMVNYDPEMEFIRDILKNFPARDFSFMFSDSDESAGDIQLALSFDGSKRDILDKIAGRSASEGDVALLFGEFGFIADFLDIYEPEDSEEFYEIGLLDLYFTSFENLLIMGDSEETLKRSLAACKNRFKRQKFDMKGSGDNTVQMTLGRYMTSDVLELMSDMIGHTPSGENHGRLNFEGDFKLTPGGWEMDLFSNVVRSVYGSKVDDFLHEKSPGTFFSAGGGRLIAAVDSTPNLQQLSVGTYGFMSNLNWYIFELLQLIEESQGGRQADEFKEALMSVDRLNFALTADELDSSDLRGYLLLSSSKEGASKKMEEVFSALLREHPAIFEGEVPLVNPEQIDISSFESCYSVLLPSEMSLFTKQNKLTFAFGDRGFLAGVMQPTLLDERFTARSELYSEMSNASGLMETVYFDMRFLRKAAKTIVEKTGASVYARRILATIFIPLVDVREIGLQTHSPEHFSLKFRTGWMDFEERDFINGLILR